MLDVSWFLVPGFLIILTLSSSSGHRLIWVMGIAHDDITFSNLMCDQEAKCGVLNDFDLVSMMESGAESLPSYGHSGIPGTGSAAGRPFSSTLSP